LIRLFIYKKKQKKNNIINLKNIYAKEKKKN